MVIKLDFWGSSYIEKGIFGFPSTAVDHFELLRISPISSAQQYVIDFSAATMVILLFIDDASVVTSSSEMSYFSPAPSTANLVFSSSVIATTPGFFVRFLINVDLKQNVSNISFVKQLEERILDAYRIGSASGAQNSSVRVSDYDANEQRRLFFLFFISVLVSSKRHVIKTFS